MLQSGSSLFAGFSVKASVIKKLEEIYRLSRRIMRNVSARFFLG